MLIEKLEFLDHRFEFKGGKYVMSHVTQEELVVRILRLETEDGNLGWGEIVRKTNVDRSAAEAEETSILASLTGIPLSDLPNRYNEIGNRGKLLRGLAFGLSTAFLDWQGRQTGQPMYGLIGELKSSQIPEYYSLSCEEPEKMKQQCQIEAKGWPVVQVKLGVGSLELDRQRIDVALSSLDENQLILLDFNGELDVASSLAIMADYDDTRIVWEEPCDNVEDNSEVARRSNKPVMFDQCLDGLEAYRIAVSEGLAHSLCIKAPFLGSMETSCAARDMCIEAGMKMRVDGPWCGHIASAACLHLAATIPPELLIAGCDLRQAFEIDDDWGGTNHLAGHCISASNSVGHGVSPPPDFDLTRC